MCFLGSFQLNQIEFRKSRRSRGLGERRKSTRVTCARASSSGCNRGKLGSISRARFRILILGSLLHASFFVLMGTATGLSNVLIAYFTASLGKAFLNSESSHEISGVIF